MKCIVENRQNAKACPPEADKPRSYRGRQGRKGSYKGKPQIAQIPQTQQRKNEMGRKSVFRSRLFRKSHFPPEAGKPQACVSSVCSVSSVVRFSPSAFS